jgi:hypothetical protein
VSAGVYGTLYVIRNTPASMILVILPLAISPIFRAEWSEA